MSSYSAYTQFHSPPAMTATTHMTTSSTPIRQHHATPQTPTTMHRASHLSSPPSSVMSAQSHQSHPSLHSASSAATTTVAAAANNGTSPRPALQYRLPVELVSSSSSPVTAELVLSVASTGADHTRCLHLRIDNPRDPAFLFHADITPAGFKQLVDQRELNGAVTFESLSGELERHMRKVQEGHDRPLQEWEWTLACHFSVTPNDFGLHELRLLTRTSAAMLPLWTLPFKAATDAQVKQFMLDAWTHERDTRESLQSQVSAMHERISQLEQSGEAARLRLQQLALEQESALREERVKCDRDLVDERTRHAHDRESLTRAHEAALSSLAHEWTSKHAHLASLHESTQKDLATVSAERHLLKNKLDALVVDHERGTEESRTLRTEKEQIRTELHQAKDECAQQAHALAQLQRKVDQLESACAASEKYLSLVQDGGSKDHAARLLLEEQVSNLKRDLAHLGEKHQATLDEFARGESTMTKLQSRLKECKSSIERKRATIAALEKKLEEKELVSRDHIHAMSDLKRDLVACEGEKARLEAELTRSQKQTQDAEAELATRVRMFEALSNQQTAQQIGSIAAIGAGAPTSTSTYQPTTFTSSMHSALYGQSANTSVAPSSFFAHPASSHLTTPLHPSMPTRSNTTLDFDSPAPLVPSHAKLPSHLNPSTGPRPASYADHPGISLSARHHLAQRAVANVTAFTTSQRPMTYDVKESHSRVHLDSALSPTAVGPQTRAPLGNITSQRNNLQQHQPPQYAVTKHNRPQTDALSNYAPINKQ